MRWEWRRLTAATRDVDSSVRGRICDVRRLTLRHGSFEFPTGSDVELGENVAQMPLDGSRTQEQLGTDLAIGPTTARENPVGAEPPGENR